MIFLSVCSVCKGLLKDETASNNERVQELKIGAGESCVVGPSGPVSGASAVSFDTLRSRSSSPCVGAVPSLNRPVIRTRPAIPRAGPGMLQRLLSNSQIHWILVLIVKFI